MSWTARIAATARGYLQGGMLALARFNRDDGWAIASHITLSGILALFPFLIFSASLTAFLDLGEFPDTAVHLIFDIWPESVAGALAAEVRTVLTEPRGDVLTFGAMIALFFASSGVEALRLGLNRAYKVSESRNAMWLRLQSIAFVIVAAVSAVTITFALVLLPLGLALARKFAPGFDWQVVQLGYWRLGISGAVLVGALLASHKWLPDGRRSLGEILPGMILTLVLWLAASTAFAAYLEGFADYVGTYAGLAGIMVSLIFVYIMSAIFLIGAEFNSALRERGRKPAQIDKPR